MSKLLSVHKEDAAFSVPKLGKMRRSDVVGPTTGRSCSNKLCFCDTSWPLNVRLSSAQVRLVTMAARRVAILHPPLRR